QCWQWSRGPRNRYDEFWHPVVADRCSNAWGEWARIGAKAERTKPQLKSDLHVRVHRTGCWESRDGAPEWMVSCQAFYPGTSSLQSSSSVRQSCTGGGLVIRTILKGVRCKR